MLSTLPGAVSLGGGCTAWTGDLGALLGPVATVADGSGKTTLPLVVPNTPSLEGQSFDSRC